MRERRDGKGGRDKRRGDKGGEDGRDSHRGKKWGEIESGTKTRRREPRARGL